MNILIIGSGGREHALAWKISQSPKVKNVYCAPGNIGISKYATCVQINVNSVYKLLDFAMDMKIDLTIVGPEGPLSEGIVDLFEKYDLKVFGASKDAARIESSKSFAKNLMNKYGINTAEGETFTNFEDAKEYLTGKDFPLVVKADGLAAGKGVIICNTLGESLSALDKIMKKKEFGGAGEKVVIEEFLEGEEASFMVLTDGETILPLPSSQDHKALLNGDKGPNTGGMGAYSPAPILSPTIKKKVMDNVMYPIIEAMNKEGCPYKGVLYAGLMINKGEIKVLEFNARFGDPEAQATIVRIDSDIVPLMEAVVNNKLKYCKIHISGKSSVCIVMASQGYPGEYKKNLPIFGLKELDSFGDTTIFHAGTNVLDGHVVATGGRVLGVTVLGNTLKETIDKAYRTVSNVHWENVYYRTDIGKKGL